MKRRITSSAVGYKNPPRHSQFKPGQSGNQRGRPKGALNLATDLKEELSEHIKIREDGKEKRLSKQRIVIKALVAKAAKGDVKAAGTLFAMILKTMANAPEPGVPEILGASDADILAEYFSRRIAALSPEPKSPSKPTQKLRRRHMKRDG